MQECCCVHVLRLFQLCTGVGNKRSIPQQLCWLHKFQNLIRSCASSKENISVWKNAGKTQIIPKLIDTKSAFKQGNVWNIFKRFFDPASFPSPLGNFFSMGAKIWRFANTRSLQLAAAKQSKTLRLLWSISRDPKDPAWDTRDSWETSE